MKQLIREHPYRWLAIYLVLIGGAVYLFFVFALHMQLISSFPQQQISLSVWSPDENVAAFQTIVTAYHKKHPNVSISLVQRDPTTYATDLNGALNGSGGPDIVAIQNGLLPRYQTLLAPAPSGLTLESVQQDYVPAVASDMGANGKVYGLPLSLSDLVLYYHKNTLAKAGIAPPKTWQDVLATVGKLTTRTGLSLSGTTLAMGTSDTTLSATDILQLLMLQNGTTMDNPSHTAVAFTDATQGGSYYPGSNALDFYSSFANPLKQSYNYASVQGSNVALFTAGDAVMIVAPSSLAKQLEGSVTDLGIATLPQVEAGQSVNLADYWAYGVSHNSPNAFVAWNFLRFAVSQKEAQAYDAATGMLSARLDVLRMQSGHGLLGPVAKQAASSGGAHLLTWYGLHWPETDAALGTAIDTTLASQATPQQALTTAAQTIDLALAAAKTQLDATR